MKIKRHYMLLLALVSLFMSLSLIQEAYAKYVTKATANTDLTIARWNILVNNHDITDNNDFSNAIEPTFPGNEHIASGILAPLSEGYIDLIVDSTKVDVSFKQKITLGLNSANTITDLEIVGYSINNSTITYFNNNATEIEDTILLTNTSRTNTYRVFVKWIDGTNETMDNEADTQATIDGVAKINVEVDFTQIAN